MNQTNIHKYPAYKDSGVQWLGEIPEEWEIEKGKWLFIKQERPISNNAEIITCFRDGQVTLRKNRRLDRFTNAIKEHGYQGVKKGDLVIHAMDAFAGAIGVSDSEGKSTPVYSICTPRSKNLVNQYFYAYFLRNLALNGFIQALAKGIRERSTDFRYADFSKLLLPFPPLPEQTAIAQFLDNKTTKIDKTIAQKERLIELLKERKQIMIQNAVTKGLNPNVKMKDSGVEWIGEIPEAWEVRKLKYVLKLINKKEPSKNSSYQYIGMENIESNTGKYIKTQSEVEGLANKFLKGDILFGKLRPYLAKVYLADFEGLCSTEFLIYRRKKPSYFQKLLLSHSFITMVDASTYGAKMPRASSDWIGNRYIPVPKLDEQIEIVKHIETQTTKINRAITLQEQQIEKLKEYKSVLIDSAVTGKIKVS